jgi:hypothetical protein
MLLCVLLLLLLLLLQVLGDAASEPQDIGDVPDLAAALTAPSLEGLIVGAPTWNTGADEGRSGTAWDDVLAQVKGELPCQGLRRSQNEWQLYAVCRASSTSPSGPNF